jgi:hypothetical protein
VQKRVMPRAYLQVRATNSSIFLHLSYIGCFGHFERSWGFSK